jgi:hypothetical protein
MGYRWKNSSFIGHKYAYLRPGSGERLVKTPVGTRVALNHVFFDRPKHVRAFIAALCKRLNIKTPEITVSSACTTHRWGTGWRTGSAKYPSGRVIIYRWSVWVVLHEMAHVMAMRPLEDHGPTFARRLDHLCGVYFDMIVNGEV